VAACTTATRSFTYGSAPGVPVADHTEVLHLIDAHRLYGQRLGWIDAHLLASALLTGRELWTSDRLLHALADRVGL
jgi:predicted nucleic acid-binding protein